MIRYGSHAISYSLHNLHLLPSQALHVSDVKTRYALRLPSNLPVVLNRTVAMQQNGEIGDHSNDPAYYEQPIPTLELSIIALSAFDFDDQPGSPNYGLRLPSPPSRMRIYISTTYTTLQLYMLDGTPIIQGEIPGPAAEVEIPFDVASQTYPIRCRPPLDVVSTPTNEVVGKFQYWAGDADTSQPSAGATFGRKTGYTLLITHFTLHSALSSLLSPLLSLSLSALSFSALFSILCTLHFNLYSLLSTLCFLSALCEMLSALW
jgi:hypothetical protein